MSTIFEGASRLVSLELLFAVIGFASFRLLPFAVYACVSPRVPITGQMVALGAYGGLVAAQLTLGSGRDRILWTCVGMAYFALCAVATHGIAPLVREGVVGRRALFVLCVLLYLVVPALATPTAVGGLVLILGWDMMLSAFSYCVDTAREEARPRLRDALFFLLVNPTLVYRERGSRVGNPRVSMRAAMLIAMGLLGVACSALLAQSVPLLSALPLLASSAAVASYGELVVEAGGLGLALYFMHASVANIQIGLMRTVGYEVPPRYDFPLLATSPQRFWLRWNIWVGRWVHHYVFLGLTLAVSRRWRRLPPRAAGIVAAIAVFVFVGVLHDVYFYAIQLTAPQLHIRISFTLGFALFGVAYAAWLGFRYIARRPAIHRMLGRIPRPALVTLQWLVFVHFLVLMSKVLLDESVGQSLAGGLNWVAPWLPLGT